MRRGRLPSSFPILSCKRYRWRREQTKPVLPAPAVRAREKELLRHESYFLREQVAGSWQQAKRETPRQFARHQCQEQFATLAACGRLNRSLDARKRKEVSAVHQENVRALSRRPALPRRFVEGIFRFLPHLSATRGVNHAISCDMQQPCFRFFRNAFRWPSFQRRDERVAERVFRAGDVARSRREISDKPAI